MSFPIFFKMEIKKGWRKSCDFVISNPVSGVNWRDLIVQALHNQRTAQIHINLSVHTPSALSARAEAPTQQPWWRPLSVQKGHPALHTWYLSSMAQTPEGADARMSISTKPSQPSGELLRPNGEGSFDFLLVVGVRFACGKLKKIKPRKHSIFANLRSSYDLKTSSTHLPSRTKAELRPHSTRWVWSSNRI